MTFSAAFRKELLEQWRTYRMLIVVIVLLVFGMTSPLVARFTPEVIRMTLGEEAVKFFPKPTITDAIAQYVKNVSQFGLILGIFVSMGAVAQEKERGTVVLMLVKPLGRGTFLLAKLLALAVTFLVGIALAGVAGYYYTVYIFGAPNLGAWLGMNALLWLFTLVFVAVTLMGSTLFKSQAAAAGIGFGALLVFTGLGAIPRLGEYLPGQLVTWSALLFNSPAPSFLPAVWISLGVIAVSLLSAWLVFEQQEL
jgi:ABC-2 type transport system permease protein